MEFLAMRVHQARLEDALIAIKERTGEMPATSMVFCPRCGLGYMAVLEGYPQYFEFIEEEMDIADMLEAECPDHPHRFTFPLAE